MRCSVFENHEDVAGWKAGSSVAYCETCIEEKMTKELNHKDVGHEEDFQKQTSGAKTQEAGQSAKPDSLKTGIHLASVVISCIRSRCKQATNSN